MATGAKVFLAVLFLVTFSCILVLQLSLDGWIPRGKLHWRQINYLDTKREKVSPNPLPIPVQQINISSTGKYNSTFPVVISPLANQTARLLQNRSKEEVSNQLKSISRPPTTARTKVQIRQLHVSRVTLPAHNVRSQFLVDRRSMLEELLHRNEVAKLLPKAIKAIQAMPTVKPENIIRVILITYFRSGSSFVGELLQQNWKTFYQFEPLHYMTYGKRISNDRLQEAFELFHGIYHCNFTNLDNYFRWVRGKRNQFLFSRSLFLWFSCRTKTSMCFDPRFVSAVCSRAPVQVVKVTRLHMSQLRLFLEENPDLNIKVVYLSRDPRGIVSSRWTLDWCNETNCSDPGVLCREMEEDMTVFQQLKNAEPSKFIQVRYEDMALDPRKEAVKLFNFLHLPFSSSVQRYLKSHSVARKADNLNPYSTRRNSSSMAFSWRSRLSFDKVKSVQESCANVITMLNFSLVTAPEELDSVNKTVEDHQKNRSSLNNFPNDVNTRSGHKINYRFLSEKLNKTEIAKQGFAREKLRSWKMKSFSNHAPPLFSANYNFSNAYSHIIP